MTEDSGIDRAVVDRLVSTPRLVQQAAGFINRGGGDTGACLFARRDLDIELYRVVVNVNGRTYREAARRLRLAGDEAGARTLARIAGTDRDLAEAAPEWAARYRNRVPAARERAAALLLASPHVRLTGTKETRGDDGAWYRPASITVPGGPRRCAVIVTSDADATEAVTGFADRRARDRWLRDRVRRGAPGWPYPDPARAVPVVSCDDGPLCRAVREDRVLAWILRDATLRTAEACGLAAESFTTHARAEIYLAWAALAARAPGGRPGPGDVRDELGGRVLRVPRWAVGTVGWPFGQRAVSWLDRLAVTPVTETAARAAARHLAAEAAEAIAYDRAHCAGVPRWQDRECSLRLTEPAPVPPPPWYVRSPGPVPGLRP